jgi:hypothetical protein
LDGFNSAFDLDRRDLVADTLAFVAAISFDCRHSSWTG